MTARAREVGEQFAVSLANKDRSALVGLLAEDIDFRAMTPGRVWDAASPAEIVDDVILGHWFDPNDDIRSLDSVDTFDVADRTRVGYRLTVHNGDGTFLIEQQAYFSESDGRINWLRIMCSGYRPLTVGAQASESS
jgi:hypothetical protein